MPALSHRFAFTPLLAPDSGSAGSILQPKTIVIGYGNPDREDDGVAWHLLNRLSARLDPDGAGMGDESLRSFSVGIDLHFSLQLTPEMAELIADYERVCFIDAHTGSEPEDISISTVTAQFQNSPFTHHLTPASCMSIVQTLYHKEPQALLVAVRGFEFGFSQSLSAQTLQLAVRAEESIWAWLHGLDKQQI